MASNLTNEQIQAIVQRVVRRVLEQQGVSDNSPTRQNRGEWGVFEDINDAIEAAHEAFLKYREFDIQDRKKFTDAVRQMTLDHKE